MKLGLMLTAYMSTNGLSIRAFAKEIGMDHSTLHRLLQGRPCTLDTLTKILCWLTK